MRMVPLRGSGGVLYCHIRIFGTEFRLFHTFAFCLDGASLLTGRPQRRGLALISEGTLAALAEDMACIRKEVVSQDVQW